MLHLLLYLPLGALGTKAAGLDSWSKVFWGAPEPPSASRERANDGIDFWLRYLCHPSRAHLASLIQLQYVRPSYQQMVAMAKTNLCDLPTEVIHQILLLVPPKSLATLELVSKHFKGLVSQAVLWHDHCWNHFGFWNNERNMSEKWAGNIADTDWKALYADRYRIDRHVSREINSILSTQTGRIPKSTRIVGIGPEAKDTLIRHCKVDEDAEDVLARR